MSLLYLSGILVANQVLIDLGNYAAGVLLPVTTFLLAIRYGGIYHRFAGAGMERG